VDTIMLPFRATGYTMSYLRCCRNESLTNVLNPDDTGMTLIAELSAQAQLECNSSPRFGAYPPIYTCVNKELNVLHSAFDLEGDSLVYSLCTPYAGGTRTVNRPQPPPPPPYDNIVYRPPYSLANLMGGVPLTIDPATGRLIGTPNTVGQFVIGVCVSAYKNGVLTGMTRRDFQINVRMCRDVPVANFTAPALDCEDRTVIFDNQSILSDDYLWVFDYPDTTYTSTEFEPTFTFPENGFYDVALFVTDSNKFCIDSIIHRIGAFDSQIVADFTYNVTSCTDEGIVLEVFDNSSGTDPGFPIDTWVWVLTVDGNVYTSSLQNPVFPFDIDQSASALLTLMVTATNGCKAMTAETFPLNEIVIIFNPDSDSICRGDTTALILSGNDGFDYTWFPLEFIDLSDEFNPLAFPDSSITYYVTVTDGLCVVTDSIHVDVQQLPVLAFEYETDCKSLFVIFDNNSVDGILFHWDFGVLTSTSDTSNLNNPTFTYPMAGEYIVTLSSRDGCDVSVTEEITANAITEELQDTAINCFHESVPLNPNPNPNYTYIWSPAEFLNFPNIGNPLATVEDDTEFCVTISQASLPGCQIEDCITVIVPDEFEVAAGSDITSCTLEKITLTATSTGNDNVLFTWTDITGDTVLGTGPTLIVEPQLTTTYIVTAEDTLGCSKSDTVTINRPPPTFFVEAFSDTTYCNIQVITLVGQSIPGVTFEWFNSSDVLVGEGPTVDVTPGSPTFFVLIGTDPLGCQNSDTVNLTPVFFDLTISGDQNICLEENTIVTITDNNDQNLMYTWYPIETIVAGAGTDTAIVDPSVTTTYCVIVKNNDLGCIDSSNCTTVTVDIFDPFPVTITADPPGPQVIGTPIQLTVNQDPGFTYDWASTNPGEVIPGVPNPIVTPSVVPTTYSVTVTNEGGCTATAAYSVPLLDPPCTEEDIFIPEAFTPNGDGENDMLFVRGNFITSMEIHIYNRWGQEVFKSFDQADGWDGKFEGKRLAPDVFGYYMDIGCPNDKSYFKKGNVTLLE
ncbi:MAG: gliding motility-associated C-terminal domain-containing protein, partial [Saprospiraceae bacterium]